MNKKIIGAVILGVVLTASSCKKFLDIQPQEQFTSTIATSSLDGLTKTTTGAFNQIQSSNLYGGGIIANSELMADFVSADPIADYSLNQFRTRQLDANNGLSGGMWSDAYRAIYMVNVVLKYLPTYQATNPGQVQVLKGECYFIRGIMHFELLRMFAQPSGFTSDDSHLGIPIVLAPGDITHGQSVPRSTVAQVYAQIVTDLDSAIALLPASNSAFATKYAAQGFLTRVFFTQNKFAEAEAMATNVINSGLALNPTVGAIDSVVGSAGTSETVFQNVSTLPTDLADGVLTGRFRRLALTPATCYMSPAFTPYYKADSASGGTRWKTFYKLATDGGGGAPKYYWCNKYNVQTANVTVIRLAEMYLTRAECRAQLGESDDQVRADYNIVRQRAGLLADNTTSGQTALLNAIRSERDFELSVEGDRFFEIKRRKLSFSSPESGEVFPWNSPQLVYPIPLQEVRQNTNMVQNPGY